jgi:hypothetical protein
MEWRQEYLLYFGTGIGKISSAIFGEFAIGNDSIGGRYAQINPRIVKNGRCCGPKYSEDRF